MDPLTSNIELTTLPGIVAFTIAVVAALKPTLGRVAVLRVIPTWLYVVAVAFGSTFLAAKFGLIQGDRKQLLVKAVMLAAASSGFREWLFRAGQQIGDTPAANNPVDPIKASNKYGFLGLLLLGLAAAVSLSCTSRSVQSLQTGYVATFDLLADARQANVISQSDFDQYVVPASRICRSALDAARDAEKRGDNAALDAAFAAFERAMDVVKPLLQKALKAKPTTQHAAVDPISAIILIIGGVTKLLSETLPLAQKLAKGQTLTPEEQAALDAAVDRVGDRVESLASKPQ